MKILESVVTDDGVLSVVSRDNMLALRNGDTGYSCIYTDDAVYQPILIPVQELLERFSLYHEVKAVAVLGGGCCTLPRFIIKRFNNTIRIDSVEYLSAIIDLTRKYFLCGIETGKLNLIHDDAFSFIRNIPHRYDFILVDLFVGGDVIKKSHSIDFLTNVDDHLSDGGIVVFNEYKRTIEECKDFCKLGATLFQKSFIMVDEDNSYYVAFTNGGFDEQEIQNYLL